MTKLLVVLLLALAFVGGLSAQGQCPGGSCTGYYGWQTTWYPFNGSETFWVNNSPSGFTNQYVLSGQYADWLLSAAYCWTYPAPNTYIYFGFALNGGCPEGIFISESGSNGLNPDAPPPNQTVNFKMFEYGSSIDDDQFTILEMYQQYWSCEQYYVGPTVSYDMWLNECSGGF